MRQPAGSAPLCSVAETPPQEVVVPSLEDLYGYNAEADRKNAKRDEINKHSRTGAGMLRGLLVGREDC